MECYKRKVRTLFIVSLKNTGPMILHSLTAGSGPGDKLFWPPPLAKADRLEIFTLYRTD
jgi:hypothetical protein